MRTVKALIEDRRLWAHGHWIVAAYKATLHPEDTLPGQVWLLKANLWQVLYSVLGGKVK